MKVSQLWVYPIKALRGIRLESATLGPQGIQHDRRFMLCKVDEKGELKKMQLSEHPECSLFSQQFVHDGIRVEYMTPKDPLVTPPPDLDTIIHVPLEPVLDELEKADINLHQSLVLAYRMGKEYDAWFSAYFGFQVALIFIGDGRRPVLGTFSPKSKPAPKSWLSSLTNYVSGQDDEEQDWLTFTDCAPYLIATEQSLRNVSARLASCDVEMHAFRPNIVVDGEAEWDEDYWATLSINQAQCLTLTKNCNRCTSLNVDYDTGRTAQGERGTVLKKLMSDRRVDDGAKYSPVFGRYAFLTAASDDGTVIEIGHPVEVVARNTDRAVWDWPLNDPRIARHY